MAEVSEYQVLEAIYQTGFVLEFHAASILRKFTGKLRMNLHSLNELAYLGGLDEPSTVETDLVFEDFHYNSASGIVSLFQCKGGRNSDLLILIETDEINPVRYEKINIRGAEIGFNKNRSFQICDGNTIVCHTGDFFQLNTKNSLQSRGQKNSFYEGIRQLNNSIASYYKYEADGKSLFELVPVIITNCEISIVRFKKDQEINIEKPTIFRNVKWCLYKNELQFINGSLGIDFNWGYFTDEGGFTPASIGKNIPYFWIVNVSALEEFMSTRHELYEK